MKLVDDWKRAWRWFCMHAMAAALAIQGAWLAIPQDMQQFLHPEVTHAITAILLALGIVGRLVKQG